VPFSIVSLTEAEEGSRPRPRHSTFSFLRVQNDMPSHSNVQGTQNAGKEA